MHRVLRPCLTAGVTIVCAGTIVVPPMTPPAPDLQVRAVRLSFDGTTQVLYTPEGLYPFTGVKSLPFDTSEDQDAQALYGAIMNQIDGGHVDAANPVVVFGWSPLVDLVGLIPGT
jgi:hypothetical protein